MVSFHTCLQSLCEEASLVMRGCCWDEKPRLSIILLHRRSSSVSHLFALSLRAQRLFSYDSDTGNHDASPSCGGRQWFFFLSLLFFWGDCLAQLRDTPTGHTGPAGFAPGIFQVLAAAKHLQNNKPSVSFPFFLPLWARGRWCDIWIQTLPFLLW